MTQTNPILESQKVAELWKFLRSNRFKDLTTLLLLQLIVNGKDILDAILAGINEGSLRVSSTALLSKGNRRYCQFVIDKKRSRTVLLAFLKRLPVY